MESNVLKIKDLTGNWIEVPALKGDPGNPGVHIGPEEPESEEYSVWIDDDEEGINIIDSLESDSASDILSARQGKVLDEKKQDKYRIGDEIITNENINPSEDFGGAWELTGKDYINENGSETFNFDKFDFMVTRRRCNDGIQVRFEVMVKETINPSEKITYDMDYSSLGANVKTNSLGIFGGNAYATDSFLVLDLYSETIIVRNITTSSISSGSYYFNIFFAVKFTDKVDSFCDKFYWRRVA